MTTTARQPNKTDHAVELLALLSRDRERSRIPGLVDSLYLPDRWIGAGFIRNAVWDHLHGRPPSRPTGDVARLALTAPIPQKQ